METEIDIVLKVNFYQTANDESKPGFVVMLSGCDKIPFLSFTSVARLNLDGRQILPEIP